MSDAPAAYGFLDGGGEMGALIRAFDWSRTPVGAPPSWSSSLRTALGILLNSHHPMFLWWGRDLIQFYNDGYRPSLGGDRHPAALGAKGREFWAEIWPTIGSEIEGVMQRGASTWHHDHLVPIFRNGRLEEVYWTYGYSPVHDDDGRIGGTLVVVQEQTARVLGERRLRTLRDLAALAATSQTEADVWLRGAAVLAQNPSDLPMVLMYAASGLSTCSADVDRLTNDSAEWPVRQVMDGGEPVFVRDIPSRIRTLRDIAAQPVESAWVVPVRRPGGPMPYGVLVAGLSPRLSFDAQYRDFITLAADHIATCISSARLREEERQRAEALAELDRAKTSFFSNVSHEFRTPLTLMLGPTEHALASPSRSLAGDDLQMVYRNQQRLMKLVNTLLDFARIEAGRAQAVYQPTDLARLTEDTASAFRSTIEHAGLIFDVDCRPLPQAVDVDRDMWEQIVSNLLSNAFKFTLEGGIAVALRWHDTFVELSVRDTGVGIDRQELPRIFERFHRAAEARGRTNEGSGIGLSLLQELVKMHGGQVEATSVKGQGSTFTVTVPVRSTHAHATEAACSAPAPRVAVERYVDEARRWSGDSPSEAALAAAPSMRATASVAAREPFHVLAVDDNADMRAYLQRILEPKWDIELAVDGAQALAAARRRRPDLIVADVMMPGIDGINLVRELRADAHLCDVPVILLTARAGEGAHIDGWLAGADDYLVKPFSPRELVALIEARLVRGRLRAVEEQHARRLASIFEHAPVAIATLRGADHVFEFANPAYLELVGHRPIVGKPIREALPELADQGIYELLDSVYLSGGPYTGRALRAVLVRGQGRAAEEVFFDVVYQPTFAADGTVDGIVVVAYEVTEPTRARQELERRVAERTIALQASNLRLEEALRERMALEAARSEWLRKLITAQEDERRRIARELHDEMGQHLSVLSVGLEELRSTAPLRAGWLRKQVDEIERGVRRVARDLRPAALDDLGLVTALSTHVEEWGRQHGIAADFCSRACDRRLPPIVETTVYRIVQEALTNVARHAHAQNVSVVLECVDQHITAIIEDDGCGFAPDEAVASAGSMHIGLRGIRERATLLGGTLTIESSAGATSIFVNLPLPVSAPSRPGAPR